MSTLLDTKITLKGIKYMLPFLLKKRFESSNLDFLKNKTFFQVFFLNVTSRIIPNFDRLNNKLILNIYCLDLISTYRGWRHSRSLPVRGQRTWSNGWTASKLNNFLKTLKIKKGYSTYGNLPSWEIYTAILAEQVNKVWRTQWFREWSLAKKNRLKTKVHRNVYRVDLFSMSQGNVMSPVKFARLSKKKQQAFNKNHFSLGFDLGFTKSLLHQVYELRSAGKKLKRTSPVIFHKSDLSWKKKTNKKKKIDIKVKKAAHVAKKKSKKSAWD